MATFTKGYTFGATELVTAAKLHALIESATIAGVVNADVSASAAIADSKLATISTAGKVSGAAFTALANIPAGAGVIPSANLPASSASYTTTFTSANLSAGKVTVTHNLNTKVVGTVVLDNNSKVILPDDVDTSASANAAVIDLTSYGTISGTWSVRVFA